MLQGVAAMGGVVFFNIAVDSANGTLELLDKVRRRDCPKNPGPG